MLKTSNHMLSSHLHILVESLVDGQTVLLHVGPGVQIHVLLHLGGHTERLVQNVVADVGHTLALQ